MSENVDAAPAEYHVGVDENGLGARLGPLIVTAVLARVTQAGQPLLERRLRGRLAQDLGDSKRLVSHANVLLGEAWARALTGQQDATPESLFERLSLEARPSFRQHCPAHVEGQCWSVGDEVFAAEEELLGRLAGHLGRWRERGIEILEVKCASVCSKRLHIESYSGKNRFITDLNTMERLLIALRERSPSDLSATCGKVGGMADYSRYFGPLSDRLHAVLRISPALSAYHFPGLGEVRFVQDADDKHPLVMLASLVGKYVRELLMARVARFYRAEGSEEPLVSGYNDPLTQAFVRATRKRRKSLRIVDECFERP